MKVLRSIVAVAMAFAMSMPCGLAFAQDGGPSGALAAAELQSVPLATQNSGYKLKCDLPDGFTLRSTNRTFRVEGSYGGSYNPSKAELYRVDGDGSLTPARTAQGYECVSMTYHSGTTDTFNLDMKDMAPGNYVILVGLTQQYGRPAPDITRDYSFTYQKAPAGGCIGTATIDIEAFTIGLGYIEEPVVVPLYQGQNAAQVLDRFLRERGYTYQGTGGLASNFYLGSISGGSIDVSHAMVDGTVASALAKNRDDGYEFDPNGYQDENALGQYDFSSGSGWMYSVNGDFPNVGFSDWYLNDGDVMRVQFTLALGFDIGSSAADGSHGAYYPVADKDEATAYLARINSALNARTILDDRNGALSVEALKAQLTDMGASQPDVDGALDELRHYLENGSSSPTLQLGQSEIELAKGRSATLGAEVGETDGLSPQVIEWSTSDSIVATVDCNGTVTAHANGEAVISARLGTSVARCTVTVGGRPLEDFEIVPYTYILGVLRVTQNIEKLQDDGSYLLRTGESVQMEVRPIPADTTEPLSIAVESSDPQVATVQVQPRDDGLAVFSVAAKSRGEVQATVRIGEIEHAVRVVVAPAGVEGFGFYEGQDVSGTSNPGTGGGRAVSRMELLVGDLSQANHGVVNVCPLPDADAAESDPQGMEAWADDESLVDVYLARARNGAGQSFNFYRLHVYAKGDPGETDVHVRMGTYSRTLHVTVRQVHAAHLNYLGGWRNAVDFSRVVSAGDAGTSLSFWTNRQIVDSTRYAFSSTFVEHKSSGIKDWDDTTVDTIYFAKDDSDGVLAGDDVQVDASGSYGSKSASYTVTGGNAGTAWVNVSVGAPYGQADEEYSYAVRVVEGDIVPVEGLAITGDASGSQGVLAEGGATYYDENGGLRWKSFASELSVQAGGTLQLGASVEPADASAVPVWVSSDHRVAKVEPQTGRVQLLRGGDTSIMLSCGGYIAVLDLHVTEPVEELAISPGALSLSRGETIALPLTVEPWSANEAAGISWSTSDPEVATVDISGVVRAVGDGAAVITASSENGKSATCSVTVGNLLSDAYFDYAPYSISRGTQLDLAGDLRFRYADGTDADPGLEGAQWETSDEAVATVDASGRLTAVGAGTCTVTARVHGLVARCRVTVNVPLERLVLPEELEIVTGEQVTLQVALDPADATTTTGTVWTNSRESCLYMANIGWGINKSVQLTGLKPGTSVVTVTLEGKSASCVVTVKRTAAQQAVFELQQAIAGWTAEFPDPESPDADHAAYVAGADGIVAMWDALTDAQRAQVPEYGESFEPELARVESMRAVAACEAQIAALPGGDASAVAAAQAAFDALSDAQRASVAVRARDALELATGIGAAEITLSAKTYTYTGKALKPAVTVKLDGRTLRSGTDYAVSYSSNVSVGTAKVTVTGKGAFHGTKAAAFTIKKASNSATAAKTSVKKTFKANALKSKAGSVALPKVTAKFGTPKWSVVTKDKKGVLSLKSGKVSVKKGAAKGTYTVKIVAKVAGTANYAAAKSKTVTVKVTVS